MDKRRGWGIRTRTLAISLGPALIITLVLTGYFTYARLQDLHHELSHTGQLIAIQLASASEYGVSTDNLPMLRNLLEATLATRYVRFIEIRDRQERIIMYAHNPPPNAQSASQVEIFHASISRSGTPNSNGSLGRVAVGVTNEAFHERQQAILTKAGALALLALGLTFLLAWRLAKRLSAPLSDMGRTVNAIRAGDYHSRLPVPDNSEMGVLAHLINDLAQALQRASEEQQRSIDQPVAAREEAEQANRAKSDFLAMMSHELRTPLNGVLGMLQLLETTEQSREQSEYTSLATESTEHLLKVINDVLDFSRIERGALELESIPFNLADLITGSVQVFQHSATQRGLQLALEGAESLERLEVTGDPTRLRQILVNLVGNALKFTESGSIEVKCYCQPLDERLLWLTCSVHDSGIGISAERLERMFDAFQQADPTISRRYGGTGLGLSIARTLAERMGGSLHAISQESQGSTFTLELPLPFRHVQQTERNQSPLQEFQVNGLNVLLVEDNPVNQTVIEAMLRSLGYHITIAGDGAQAVSLAEQQSFSAILMDCRLPVLDGYQATRLIRQQPGPMVPIIALTANALQGDRENCLAAGMNDYLAKPFKRADLQQMLQRWISQPERSRGATSL
ncbi:MULTISPECIES: ATP-binding protein [Pseudomonas]|uniref:Sensory/regulatory protein RpfC n=1 Tax=Pseudomonas lutea TaxID=243924 RepID=A0A9X8MEN3_9PSED|nr:MULTISPECIES: ATP-binding protein [Pseudomonas]SEQ93099.1 Signal transduction histidine kinase [Pseudomonas lutea]